MNIVLKDKIKIDHNFINELITKSWQDSESIQNQIASIEIDSPQAAKLVKLLKDLLTSYYVFTGCLEHLESEPVDAIQPEPIQQEKPQVVSDEPTAEKASDTDIIGEFDTEAANASEPFEYFVDFDEPTGEPITDDDLYN